MAPSVDFDSPDKYGENLTKTLPFMISHLP
jgi:hypothetical protein